MNWWENIEVVTLDVGGTLIEPRPSVGHVYAEVAARHGFTVMPELLNRNFATAWQAKKHFNHTKSDWEKLVGEAFADVLTAPANDALFEEIYQRFAEPDAWRIYDDVIPALEQFQNREVRLAIISNWDERLRLLLPKLKLEEFFETVVISYEVGFPKPSPVIFEYALKKLGVPASSVLHVGDSFSEDFLGAQNVGCKSVLLARGEKASTPTSVLSLLEVAKMF